MIRICCLIAMTGLLVALAGCATDGSADYGDVVEPDENGSTVDTLVLLLSVQVKDPADEALKDYDGYFIDCAQIDKIRLAVNAREWGLFATEERGADGDPGAEVEGWSLQEEPCQALLLAELGREAGGKRNVPKTAEDWVQLLLRYLSPGGHVGEIEEVVLTNADGDAVELRPRELIPFTVADGDTSSFLGEVTLVVSDLGGAS